MLPTATSFTTPPARPSTEQRDGADALAELGAAEGSASTVGEGESEELGAASKRRKIQLPPDQVNPPTIHAYMSKMHWLMVMCDPAVGIPSQCHLGT